MFEEVGLGRMLAIWEEMEVEEEEKKSLIDLLGGGGIGPPPLCFCVIIPFPRCVVLFVVDDDDDDVDDDEEEDDVEMGEDVWATRTLAVLDALAASILSNLSSRSKAAIHMESTVEAVWPIRRTRS